MDPDAAAAELDAVEHEIVGLRADSERVPLETLEVLVGGRREGMVHGDVAARVRIALEEREVDHPEEAILAARHAAEPLPEPEAELREDGRRPRLGRGPEHAGAAHLEARCPRPA